MVGLVGLGANRGCMTHMEGGEGSLRVCVFVFDRAAASLSLIGGAEQRGAGGVLGSGLIDS